MTLDNVQHPTEIKSLHSFSSLHVPASLRMTFNETLRAVKWERWMGRCDDTTYIHANIKEKRRDKYGIQTLCSMKTENGKSEIPPQLYTVFNHNWSETSLFWLLRESGSYTVRETGMSGGSVQIWLIQFITSFLLMTFTFFVSHSL